MSHRFLGFFSGFPNYRFPYNIGKRLSEELIHRKSLVFVSAWPDVYERNDKESNGMYSMFEEYNIPFIHHYVIDNRMETSTAIQLIHEASCIFLMGGHPGLQLKLIREKELNQEIYNTKAAVLGVSAGAINMAKNSLDTKESLVPYKGLGLADITIKPHFKRAVSPTVSGNYFEATLRRGLSPFIHKCEGRIDNGKGGCQERTYQTAALPTPCRMRVKCA